MDATLRRAFNFFREHAGYVVGENARGALTLARAERDARDAGISFIWRADPYADWSFVETWDAADVKRWAQSDHEAEGCRAVLPCASCVESGWSNVEECRHTIELASLWGIIDADAAYRRVIEAELAAESLHHLDQRAA
jgi:hypothetical protein